MNSPSILSERIVETSRSLGVKLMVVCGLALLMTLPAFFVSGLVGDRTQRAGNVIQEISAYSGGQQTFLGPTLLIPYTIAAQAPATQPIHGTCAVFPAIATAAIKTTTEERRRSLFRVPVFRSETRLDAAFDLADVPSKASPGAEFDWSRAEIVVGVTDVRGALADATLTAGEKSSVLVPSQIAPDVAVGGKKLTLLGTPADEIARPGAKFTVSSTLRFSGAQRIALLAYGKTTRLLAQGDWANPGFDGGFLPVRRTVSKAGYTAEWLVPFIARGVSAQGPLASIAGLESTALGTSFVEVADPYQSVNRSLKYVLLFLGLVFLSYFVFEVATGKRVHPAQYVLVGIAQTIFYLLLLSFSERMGFNWGFLTAAAGTVALLSANTGWVFSSLRLGIRALAMFGVLYALIYLLLRMEDNALLVGAIASFLATAATMYLTRKVDWYGTNARSRSGREMGPAAPGATS